ncbi:MAG: pyridoxamine 5'-phosphate oxidase family protein [Candidatus Promineifilaceae bacterium]|jgi:F420H(2)-dependent biliverdin reductase
MRRRNPARWRAMEGRLGRETEIWMATVRHDGRPHLTPMWFVWLNEKIYVSTPSQAQKFINMRHNQSVALSLTDALNVIIIEGEAHVADRALIDELADYFFNKYEWDFRYDDSAKWQLVEITPLKILAWGDGFDESEGTRLL